MRLSNATNWLLLCGNCLLFIFLLARSFARHDYLSGPGASKITRDAATLGMDPFCAKYPFAIFIDRNSAHDEAFTFLQYHYGISLTVDKKMLLPASSTEGIDANLPAIQLCLGRNFDICVDCYSSHNDVQVNGISISRDKGIEIESFDDENADGSYDYRMVHTAGNPVTRSYVFLAGDWKQITRTFNEHRKVLLDGRVVVFNKGSGKWEVAE